MNPCHYFNSTLVHGGAARSGSRLRRYVEATRSLSTGYTEEDYGTQSLLTGSSRGISVVIQLGAEIAKNLILTGFKRVVVCDNELVKLSDLASNFFLREHHVAKVTRAEAIRRELSSLNPAVDVQVTSNSDISFISRNFDCVVISDWYDLGYLIELSKACRKAGTGFIYTGNLGLYGFGFVDFGDQRQVLDTDGETCKESFVTNISRDNEGWVEVHDYNPHEFEDGSFVRFR
ncbi:MAG: ThiF family adenylyltransferase [Actinobacteria bacterium]|nr:ThiF family adenylyltransferase [Actinomycetota bacterium]